MKKQTSQDTTKSRLTPYDASELPINGKKYHISHFSSSYNSVAIRENKKTDDKEPRASLSVQLDSRLEVQFEKVLCGLARIVLIGSFDVWRANTR
jgi:hypothetical protein